MASQVLWASPTARQHSYWYYGLRPSSAGLAAGPPSVTAQLSRFPFMVLTHMPQVSDSGELKPVLALSYRLMLPSPS
jgi:hypothetical protein